MINADYERAIRDMVHSLRYDDAEQLADQEGINDVTQRQQFIKDYLNKTTDSHKKLYYVDYNEPEPRIPQWHNVNIHGFCKNMKCGKREMHWKNLIYLAATVRDIDPRETKMDWTIRGIKPFINVSSLARGSIFQSTFAAEVVKFFFCFCFFFLFLLVIKVILN